MAGEIVCFRANFRHAFWMLIGPMLLLIIACFTAYIFYFRSDDFVLLGISVLIFVFSGVSFYRGLNAINVAKCDLMQCLIGSYIERPIRIKWDDVTRINLNSTASTGLLFYQTPDSINEEHVPVRFGWMKQETARTFCSFVLERCPNVENSASR